MTDGPPAGATLVSDNPTPFVIAPKQMEGTPPKGATLVKADVPAPNAGLSQPSRPPTPEGLQPSGFVGRTMDRVSQNMQSIPDTVNKFLKDTQGNPKAVPGAVYDLVKGVGKGVGGISTPGIAYRLFKKEDPANIAGDAAMTFMPGSEEAAGGVRSLTPEHSLDAKGVARVLTDAVNPSPKSMPAYESTLSSHMPKVLDWASRNGLKIVDRESLASAMKGAHDELKADYDSMYIDPVRDEWVPTTYVKGYSGGTVNPGTATIGQLNARLSEINATLSPSYEKGGLSAQVAISAEAKSALNSEAAGIRKVLNDSVGKKLGVDPKQVADARSVVGSLRNAADKTQISANQARYVKNMNDRGIDLPTSKAGVVHKIARKVFSKDADKVVADTMEKLRVEPPTPQAESPLAPAIKSDAMKAAEMRQKTQQQIQQTIRARAQALKAASAKLGPKASVKEIMAEADKNSP
jgi:hypothetical protein